MDIGEWMREVECDDLRAIEDEMRQKKPTAIETILAERINLGGEIMTRKEAYDLLIAEGNSPQCADYFAFSTPTFSLEKEH